MGVTSQPSRCIGSDLYLVGPRTNYGRAISTAQITGTLTLSSCQLLKGQQLEGMQQMQQASCIPKRSYSTAIGGNTDHGQHFFRFSLAPVGCVICRYMKHCCVADAWLSLSLKFAFPEGPATVTAASEVVLAAFAFQLASTWMPPKYADASGLLGSWVSWVCHVLAGKCIASSFHIAAAAYSAINFRALCSLW